MRITQYTDYALRLLMYLAVRSGRATIAEAADALGVSRNHLVKVASRLGELGHVDLLRGRNGGVRLDRAPVDITIGQVFRELESSVLVECFGEGPSDCVLASGCGLNRALSSAFDAFCAELDAQTLADLTRQRKRLRAPLGLDAGGLPV